MRLLHVSDWHLGRVTYGASRAPDHRAVLDEIVDVARHEKPELVLHTGDLFDSVRPGYADMELAIDALQRLGALAQVVVLLGNHDSAALFRVFQRLLGERSRVRFVDRVRRPSDGGVLELEGRAGERVRLASVPFVHANRLIEALEDPSQRTVGYADRVKTVQDALGHALRRDYDPRRDVLLFAAHLHVSGAVLSTSERPIHVSEHYASRVETLPAVSYAAFGHIHRPQALGGPVTARYAGSPLQMDFGELGEEKSVVLVDARPGQAAEVRTIPLKAGRALRRLDGTLAQLRAEAETVGDALCLVTARTETTTPDLAQQLASWMPRASLLQVHEVSSAQRLEALDPDTETEGEEPGFEALFRQFLAERGARKADAAAVAASFDEILRAVEAEESWDAPEGRAPDVG